MSQQLNEPGTANQQASLSTARSTSGRTAWRLLGLGLWVLALVMGFVVWKGAKQLRESIQARGQAPAIRITADDPSVAGSKTPLPPESMWDASGIKDFSFTERSGRKVTKSDLLGHPWLVSFIFTRCAGPCPKVSGRMSELQRLLAGTDVKLVTLTVDPDFDKPDVLERYARAFGADANRWLYLTGDKEKTYRLINDSFKMPVKELTGPAREPGYEVLHSVNILRVNEKGVVVAKYNALDDVDVVRLEHDLRPYIDRAKADRATTAGPASAPAKGAER
jgi:cytochrome oxidase Cu insertion factor (SCO1/SenC/PrrC family)